MCAACGLIAKRGWAPLQTDAEVKALAGGDAYARAYETYRARRERQALSPDTLLAAFAPEAARRFAVEGAGDASTPALGGSAA